MHVYFLTKLSYGYDTLLEGGETDVLQITLCFPNLVLKRCLQAAYYGHLILVRHWLQPTQYEMEHLKKYILHILN